MGRTGKFSDFILQVLFLKLEILLDCCYRRSEGKAQSREDKMAVQPRVLPRQFRWGLLLVHPAFSSTFSNPAERVASVNGQKTTKVESRTSEVNRRHLVCGRRRKTARTHVGALLE